MKYARPPDRSGVFAQRINGIDVRRGGIDHVDGVDAILAIANDSKPPATGAIEHPWKKMRIILAPDQMRSQRNVLQSSWFVRPQHGLLGHRFGVRIVAQPSRGVGLGLVDAALMIAIESHARAAGKDQVAESRWPGKPQ